MHNDVIVPGQKKPARALAINAAMLGVVLILGLYGMWVDFIVAAEWVRQSFYFVIVLTSVSTVLLYWGFGTGQLVMRRDTSRIKKVLIYTSAPFFFGMIYYLGIVHGGPDLITLAIGDAHVESTVLSKMHKVARRSCDYRLVGEALERAEPEYLCISKTQYENFPAEEVVVKLEGKRSFLGFHVSRFRLEPGG